MHGRAPAGYYTAVVCRVTFANGRTYISRWTSPLGLAVVYHKAPKWAKLAATVAKAKGRSRITAIETKAALVKGWYSG